MFGIATCNGRLTSIADLAADLNKVGFGSKATNRVPSFVLECWKNGAPDRMKLGTHM
jgi:hypothetical protein